MLAVLWLAVLGGTLAFKMDVQVCHDFGFHGSPATTTTGPPSSSCQLLLLIPSEQPRKAQGYNVLELASLTLDPSQARSIRSDAALNSKSIYVRMHIFGRSY